MLDMSWLEHVDYGKMSIQKLLTLISPDKRLGFLISILPDHFNAFDEEMFYKILSFVLKGGAA